MLEQIRTAVAETPIPKPFTREVVVARVGHVPRTSTSTGFSFIRPLVKIETLFLFSITVHLPSLHTGSEQHQRRNGSPVRLRTRRR